MNLAEPLVQPVEMDGDGRNCHIQGRVTSTGLLMVDVSVDGEFVPMVVDTGASKSMLARSVVDALELEITGQTGRIATANGNDEKEVAEIAEVT